MTHGGVHFNACACTRRLAMMRNRRVFPLDSMFLVCVRLYAARRKSPGGLGISIQPIDGGLGTAQDMET